jgi:hypothetical protein
MTGLCAPATCMAGHQVLSNHFNEIPYESQHASTIEPNTYRAILTLLCSVRPRGLAIKARVLMHVKSPGSSPSKFVGFCLQYLRAPTTPSLSYIIILVLYIVHFFFSFLLIFSFICYFHVLSLHTYIRTPPPK